MMMAMTTREHAADGPWRCPRCDADRAAEDTFCGRCGARRPLAPAVDTGDGSGGADAAGRVRPARIPVRRALALNGVVIAAVLAAVLLGSNGGPGTIRFEPAAWRCDGTERAWIAAIPARAPDLRVEWLTGGPAGTVLASSTTTLAQLEPYRQADGSYRVTTTATDAPECSLRPGVVTMAIRDAANGALLASGDVEVGR
jgi:hypothetical protein